MQFDILFLLFMKIQLAPHYANITKSNISLKAGKEIQHNLLEFSVGGFRDFAIGPTRKEKKKRIKSTETLKQKLCSAGLKRT